MGKIREFSITTSLPEDHVYLAGSKVEGNFLIDLKKPKAISGPLRIVLSGQARVRRGGPPEPPYYNGRLRYESDAQSMFQDMKQYYDTGSETLLAGKHEFLYAFRLPSNISSSYAYNGGDDDDDYYGQIRYTLTAVIPTKKKNITREKLINVKEIVIIDTPELIGSVSGSSNNTTIGCLCCMSAPIGLSATIDKGGYLCGETITIRANHGYRRITRVSAILRRNTTIHIRKNRKPLYNCGYETVASTSVAAFNLSRPGEKLGYLKIPNTVLSMNCVILKVSYSVIVKLVFKIPYGETLTVSLPIAIGNKEVSPQHSAPINPISYGLQNAPGPSIMPLHPLLNTPQNTPIKPLSVSNTEELDIAT